MTELVHDAPGERFYETGVSKAILFPHTGGAYVWNGMQAVQTNPTGGEPERYYFDGVAYLEIIKAEEFAATITCVNAPKEFGPCEGIYETVPGMYTHFNPRIKFNLVWVTKIANDLDQNLGYRLHIVYNAQALPASRNYQTVTDQPSPEVRSIQITTTPACGPYSYYTFDSREADVDALLSQILEGDLPSCANLTVGPPVPDEETDCINIVTDFNGYNPGQVLDEDIEVDESEVLIEGVVNNGLDLYEFPANGAYDDNSSPASPTVVGTQPVLADGDDATYIESAEGDLGYTVALPLLTGGYSEGAVFELHIRMAITGGIDPEDPDNLDAEAQVHISTDADGLLTVGGFSDGAQEGMAFKLTDVEGGIVDYVVPLRMDAWVNSSLEDVVDALEAGAYLVFLSASNFNPDPALGPPEVTIYEAKLLLINNTDGDRYLRPDPDSGVGFTETHIRTTPGGSVDQETAFTTYVDFKIKSVPDDAAYTGVDRKVIEFVDDDPGSLTATDISGVPTMEWRDFGTTDPADVSVVMEYETWYRARIYWTWGLANIKVWERDAASVVYLINRDVTTSTDPTAQMKNYAGMVGG